MEQRDNPDAADQGREPQLKYEPLQGDVPSILTSETITCLCLSDKILAVGTDAGVVHVLDYSGNEVQRLQQHKAAVTDLSFDAAGDYLVSSSLDKAVVVTSLYGGDTIRHEYPQAVQAVALDPRFASRKSKEIVVLLGDKGAVHLSAQGWLGRSDTQLFKGPGTQLVRWWGHLIAWMTGNTLMVYSTLQHLLVRTFQRPAKGPGAAYSHASLLWGQNGYLYASWPDYVQVARTFTAENNVGALTSQVELVASWQPGYLVLGVSPFGRDLAVMTFESDWEPPQPKQLTRAVPEAQEGGGTDAAGDIGDGGEGQGAEGGEGAVQADGGGAGAGSVPIAQSEITPAPDPDNPEGVRIGEGQDAILQLRVVSLAGAQLACDKLDVGPVLSLLPGGRSPYHLIPSLPATTTAATDKKRLRNHAAAAAAAHAQRARSHTSAGGDRPGEGSSTPPRPPSTPGISRASSGQFSGSVAVSESPSVSVAGRVRASHGGSAPSHVQVHNPDYDEDAEFMYFVNTGKSVLVGRMRDMSDHAEWLMQQGQWEAALTVTEDKPREVRPEVQDAVVQGFIGDLLARQAWEEAAALSPRLMKGNASMWERWVFMFAQARHLPRLAEVLPTSEPRLAQQVYDMVLQALLAAPQDQATALKLVKQWPAGCFSAPNLVEAVVARMKRGGAGSDSRDLWLLLSHLYEGQGRPDLALSILLQLHDYSAFAFITGRHEGLLAGLTGKRITQLVDLDPPRAIRLLVRHADVVPPHTVVPALQEAMGDAEEAAVKETWRKSLWSYLAAAHDADPASVAAYSELQVSLTADYAPNKLLDLLSSSSVPLESALAICEDKGLVSQQVFILGRMGNALRALHLIIDQLADIPQAIEFVEGQADDELWEQLISWALSSPETTGQLLDHIGGHLNPLALIRRIPQGLSIPHLRDRIRSIIADFRTQTSLREGCNVILRADCARLVTRLHQAAAAAVHSVYMALPPPTTRHTQPAQPPPHTSWMRYDVSAAVPEPLSGAQELPAVMAQAAAAVERAEGQGQEVQGLVLLDKSGSPVAGRVVPGRAGDSSKPVRPEKCLWLGPVPALSSEEALGAITGPQSQDQQPGSSSPGMGSHSRPAGQAARKRAAKGAGGSRHPAHTAPAHKEPLCSLVTPACIPAAAVSS